MARNEKCNTDNNINNNSLCLGNFFFFTTRNKKQPTRINRHNHTENRQKSIKILNNISNNPDSIRKISLINSLTIRSLSHSPKCTPFQLLTFRNSTIHGTYNSMWNLDENKSYQSKKQRIFPFG